MGSSFFSFRCFDGSRGHVAMTVSASRVVAIAIIVLVCGCTLSIPQVESAYRGIKILLDEDTTASDSGEAQWLASVGDYGALVKPYQTSDLIVFANEHGDAISFDGWIVRSVIGFDLGGSVSLSGRDGTRVFLREGVAERAFCTTWEWESPKWSQRCGSYLNVIELDDLGNIVEIQMLIGNEVGRLSLKKIR